MMDYTQFENYKEFKNYGKKSAVVNDMFIKVDEENKILLVNDIIDKKFFEISSEGILTNINSEIAKKIEAKLNIKIADYGVEIFDKSIISAPNEEI